ncbi:MAG: DUF2586 family protein [Bacteroidales bacterium]
MATSKTTFIRQDGNLASQKAGEDHISAMLFDVPADTNMPQGLKINDVAIIDSLSDAVKLGIVEYDPEKTNFLYGIPNFHIAEFFRMNPGGRLYIMFADCSRDWSAMATMQKVAQGSIRLFGVYTEQKLWSAPASESDPYTINIIQDLNAQAEKLASAHSPVSVLLNANTTSIDGSGAAKTTTISRIPTCICGCPRVTALIGQGDSEYIRSMQIAHPKHVNVGCLGVMLGTLAITRVCESFAWVGQFDLIGAHMSNLSLGFGDVTVTENEIVSLNPYVSISDNQLDDFDDKGYVFPMKYSGKIGTHVSKDKTCSDGDYRTIGRNRTIDKSRREIRRALLPFLNSPVLIDPKTGQLNSLCIKTFKNAIENILSAMVNIGDITAFSVNIDPKQNVQQTDSLLITYSLVGKATASDIIIQEGFALKI